MIDTEQTKRFADITSWLQNEYASIRTGQASPGLPDGIKVEVYGSYLPITQVGSVGIEDARTLRLSIWDASQIVAVEKAIREADLGVSVVTDSSGLRIIFPELTSERRVQLLKLAKSKLEEARVRVRQVRDDLMKDMERQFKAGEMSEDDKFVFKDKMQKIVDETNGKLESLFTKKESELNK